jgi:hypothetical protein
MLKHGTTFQKVSMNRVITSHSIDSHNGCPRDRPFSTERGHIDTKIRAFPERNVLTELWRDKAAVDPEFGMLTEFACPAEFGVTPEIATTSEDAAAILEDAMPAEAAVVPKRGL